MATPSDDFFIQKVILLMTGVPGTVLLRDQITQLYGETRDLNKVAVFIDENMNQRTSNIQEGVHFILDNGFNLDLTPQKIDQLTADSLREGIDTWSELFFHLTDEAEINLDQILDNRADAADFFTDILAELNANIDINDPLVHQWIDKVDASIPSLQEAKGAARGLIEQLMAAPLLIEFSPVDGALDVPLTENITLNFNEAIKAGNGNIEILGENEDPRVISITDASQITINGTLITINPLQDLSPNKNYYIQINSGVIADQSGNPFGGISDPALFNFKTIETELPILISRDPPDDAINIEGSKDIVLTFNEPIKAGNGNIVIVGENEAPRSITMTDASQVAINGNTITINPLQDLSPDKNYHIEVTSDAISDLTGNAFVGISDSTTWNFKTIDTLPPTLINSDPPDNTTNIEVGKNIVLTFSEAIKAGGSGSIQIIDEFEKDTRLISVSDTSQVTIDGNTVTINPTDDLNFGVNYSVLISPGTITDLTANPYEGIDDVSELNFITIPIVIPQIPIIQLPTQPFSYVEAILDDGTLIGQFDDTTDVIGTVVATGELPIVTYDIIAGNESGYFAIDRNGHLTLTPVGLTAASNDFEKLPHQFTLTITASDLSRTSDGVDFQVNVQNNPADDDITPPIFTSSPIASPINENSGAEQIIYTATTDDPLASYSLGGADAAAFSIESNTGLVKLRANPDYETKNNYTFTVQATDNALIPNSSQQTINLEIIDVSEGIPTLEEVFIGFFNAAPGAANLFVLEDAITRGLSINQTAELLGQHTFFKQVILAGKVTTGDQVAELMSHFGLTPGNTDPASADAQAELFFTAQFKAGSSYGRMIFDALSFLSGTHPPEFNEIATLLANKDLVARVYSSSNSSSDFAKLQSILSDVTVTGPSSESEALSYLIERGINIDNTFPLRIGADNILGTDSNDIFLGPGAIIGKLEEGLAADTFENDDRIDGGGAGDDDIALLELGANGSVMVNPEISNVEVLDITSHSIFSDSENGLDMSRINGVQRINSVASTGALSLTNVSNIIDLGLSNTDSAVNLEYSTDLSSNEDAMNIAINNSDSIISINSAGSGSLELLDLDLSLENEINLEGSGLSGVSNMILRGEGSLNLSMSEMKNLANIDASANSGGIKADLSNMNNGFTATGSSGNDDFKVSGGSEQTIIAAGAGDDRVTIDLETLRNCDLIDGGDGSDVFTFSLDSSDVSEEIANKISNFETFNFVLLDNSSSTLDVSATGGTNFLITGTGSLNLLKIPGDSRVDASLLVGSIQLDFSGGGIGSIVIGSKGNDKFIVGNEGVDVISGNEGADTFIFNSSGLILEEIDTVTDFVSGIDQLDFGPNMLQGIEGLTFRDVGEVARYDEALNKANEEIKLTSSLDYIFADNGSDSWIFVDTNFDNLIDLSVELSGTTAIAATDISGLPPIN